MLAASRLHYAYLAYFSKPQADRAIYRAIRRQGWHRLLELGISTGLRAQRMIQLAAGPAAKDKDKVRYVGVDLFEARTAGSPGMSLKEAHRMFKPLPAATQLVPGDPFSALSRTANSLREIDLVVISAGQDAESLERAWFYLPRVLHPTSVVFLEQANPDQTLSLLAMNRSEVEARVRKNPRRAA